VVVSHIVYLFSVYAMFPRRRSAPNLSRYKALCVDVVLDSSLKTGHTSVADALWGGIPVVTLMGEKLGNRAAGAMLEGVGMKELRCFTHQEYTDVAVRVAHIAHIARDSRDTRDARGRSQRDTGGKQGSDSVVGGRTGETGVTGETGETGERPLLNALRQRVMRRRMESGLFRGNEFNRDFGAALRSMWEGERVNRARNAPRFHTFPTASSCGRSGLEGTGAGRGCYRGKPFQLGPTPDDPNTAAFYAANETTTGGVGPGSQGGGEGAPTTPARTADGREITGRVEAPLLLHVGGIQGTF
jgi:hypothetical protein